MKIYVEKTLKDFEFWGGAKERAAMLTDSELESIEETLEDIRPEGMSETEVNDFFWFEFDAIANILGYEDEEEIFNERG